MSSICQARVSDGTDSLAASSAARLASPRAAVEEALRRGRDLHAGEEMRGLQQILHHRQRIGAGVIQPAQIGQRLGDLAAHQLFEHIQHPAAIGQAQHVRAPSRR